MGRFPDSPIRGLGGIVAFDGFGADPFFGDEFNRRAEEVVAESPLFSIVPEENQPAGNAHRDLFKCIYSLLLQGASEPWQSHG